jgi:adenine-specific DNA-methyltransferase
MARKSKATDSVKIDAVKHRDTRKNIPTEELRDFVADDELKPQKMLYPRNPDLDPQLVWKGKDEQDAAALEVPVVPVYIQEKVHPQAIIEDFRKTADKRPDNDDADFGGLFADFNGLPKEFDQRVDFYHHDGHWSNRLILGDSLLVMTSLAEKEALRGKVQMVFFDPPYGIKFGSNWQVSTRKRDVKDSKEEDLVRQPEQIKAFRDTWKYGVSSYLAYLRDRLAAARDLLTESGSIFIQIGDENVHLCRALLDEVFGRENFVSLITFKKTAGATSDYLSGVVDYLIWYAKSIDAMKYRQPYLQKQVGGLGGGQYSWVETHDYERRRASPDELADPPENLRFFRLDNLMSQSAGRQKGEGAASWFPVSTQGGTFRPTMQSRWKTNEEGMSRLVRASRAVPVGNTLTYVRYMQDFPVFPVNNLWDDTVTSGFSDPKMYVVQTNSQVIERCMLMTTDPGDLVLDPTCGSGTTAYVAEQWGRRWITTDTSRVALTLARTRLMAGRFPYYYLADSPEGIEKEAEVTGNARPSPLPRTEHDPRKGFVYRRVPHVTLKSIANNEEIDAIHARWQEKLEPIRTKLNGVLEK